jgi:hypothetical protein
MLPARVGGARVVPMVVGVVVWARRSATGPVWSIPKRRARFTGRRDLLGAIGTPARRERLPVVLAGMGGVGKTSTAIEYANRHRRSFRIGWWVPAGDAELVRGNLAVLAERLRLVAPGCSTDSAVSAVLDYLRDHRRWLGHRAGCA